MFGSLERFKKEDFFRAHNQFVLYTPERMIYLKAVSCYSIKNQDEGEEIRRMQSGAHTVGDGMRRHLVTLERERQNLEAAIRFCGTLTDRRERLEELDAQSLLDRMAQMEQEGTTFMNKQKQDTRRRRFVAPIVVAIVMSVLMAGLIWLFLWAFEVDPAGAPPLPVLALFVAIPAAVVVGVVIALVQRVREIERGEEDDARNY